MSRNSVIIVDDFCPEIEAVRESALASGFGTWAPPQGEVGSSKYDGMNFHGLHSLMLMALSNALGGRAVFPNSMFFRCTTPETERAYVHSDRSSGNFTCVAYLSKHNEKSGTGFFRHRRTGLRFMPTFNEMREAGIFEEMSKDMVSGMETEWEQLDFVRGLFNRAVIFDAPLFHARFPKHGIGNGAPEEARMIWACHFS